MADNVTANAGAGGAVFATAAGSWSGDTANFPGCFLAIVSGSEGSWSFSQVVGGAGAVAAGVQRMTLASDDPAVASLGVMDDWDESDRAKVNLIVGQAGIAAGNGAAGVTVPRVTLANDSTGVLAGVTTVTTVATVSTLTGGGVAHDAADSGNPHKIGAKATASVLGGTPVAAADRTDLLAGTDGVLLQRPHTSLEDIISEVKTNTDGAATAMTGAFAATASQRIYLTTLIISNSSASNITVDIRDGSAGAVLLTIPVPATGGAVINFPVPLRFSANTAAAFDGSAAATTLSVSMVGFKSKA